MSNPMHLMVVDDDADLRDAMIICLETEGHSVIGARDGREALDMLFADPDVSLIVLDLQMPVMDGWTFLEHKARGAHAAIPVVIFSSSPDLRREKLAGVIATVSKGDGIEALLAAIPRVKSALPIRSIGGFRGEVVLPPALKASGSLARRKS